MSKVPHICIVEDEPAFRESLVRLLTAHGIFACPHASAESLLEDGCTPDCVVVDIRLPGIGGTELIRTLHDANPNLRCIAVSGYGDIPMAVAAMKVGANEFLEKVDCATRLIPLIEQLTKDAPTVPRFAKLSQREREVLAFLVEGRSNKEIAFSLEISHRTVEKHRASIMKKAGADSLAQLVRWALQESRLGRGSSAP